MATNHSRARTSVPIVAEPPSQSVAAVLVVYTALYLAIVGVIHFMSSPDASAAIAPDIATAHARRQPRRSPHPQPQADRPRHACPTRQWEERTTPRECTTAIDAECIYN